MVAKTKDPSSHTRGNQYEGQTTFRFNPFPLPAISVVTTRTRNLRPHLCRSCRQKTKTGWAAGSGYLTDQIQNKCRRPLNIKHAVLFDICLFFCHIFPDDALCRLFKSTSGGSQAVGLLTRSLSTTMGSPTTLWLVIFSWEKRLQPPISRSTAAPSCPHPCSCTWWSQSSPSPRSSNMSTTSSPGERSLAIELSITNWIYPKKGGTWQIGRSTHCVGLSDVSSPCWAAVTFAQCHGRSCQIWFPYRFLRAVQCPTLLSL